MDERQTLWRIRLKPKPHEALSSWLIRLSNAHGQRLHGFSTDHWPGVALWNRDVDHIAPAIVLETLSRRIGVSPTRARATTFHGYRDVLYEGDDAIAAFGYVRPLGVYHRLRRNFGQQYCAACLASDPAPYFRLTWRLCLFPTCTTHGKILLDRCLACGSPALPHRSGMTRCHNCEASLATMHQHDADPMAIDLQSKNEAILNGHAVTYPSALIGLHPLPYFRLLLCLATLLLLGRRRNAFRQTSSSFLSVPLVPIDEDDRTPLRLASPQASHDALRAVSALTVGWPWRFVGAAQEARLWYSWAWRDMDAARAPYAFLTVVDAFLRTDGNDAKRSYKARERTM